MTSSTLVLAVAMMACGCAQVGDGWSGGGAVAGEAQGSGASRNEGPEGEGSGSGEPAAGTTEAVGGVAGAPGAEAQIGRGAAPFIAIGGPLGSGGGYTSDCDVENDPYAVCL